LIPSDAKVFLWGYSLPLYLAGIDPYLRQIVDPECMVDGVEPIVVERNGLWGTKELETWLSTDAGYAIVMPSMFRRFRPTRPRAIERMEALLAERFELIATVAEYPWWVFDVYKRRTASARNGRTNARSGAVRQLPDDL
jgi:hypothetical protein